MMPTEATTPKPTAKPAPADYTLVLDTAGVQYPAKVTDKQIGIWHPHVWVGGYSKRHEAGRLAYDRDTLRIRGSVSEKTPQKLHPATLGPATSPEIVAIVTAQTARLERAAQAQNNRHALLNKKHTAHDALLAAAARREPLAEVAEAYAQAVENCVKAGA